MNDKQMPTEQVEKPKRRAYYYAGQYINPHRQAERNFMAKYGIKTRKKLRKIRKAQTKARMAVATA